MLIIMVSTSAGMDSRADFGLKYLVFFAVWKRDIHFGGALRVRSVFPVLL